MTWDVIEYTLQRFQITYAENKDFGLCKTLLLLEMDSADTPNTVYVTDGGCEHWPFKHALLVSIGTCAIHADNRIELEQGNLFQVFNALAEARDWLNGLDSALALCNSDQEIIDQATIHTEMPMFYLDDTYRVLAMTTSMTFPDDPEWVHMSEKGYLSPQSAHKMKDSGDLDLLAPTTNPVIYRSTFYPFASIVCNLWLNGRFVSRINILCTRGETSTIMLRACEIIVTHLARILSRDGKPASDGPLQSMLIDLLHGIRLSEDLIVDRIKSVPHLQGSLMRLFYADVEAKDDRQIAPYYASMLKQLYPEETFIPLVFEEQLLLLSYAPDEQGFDALTVKLAHFFATHHIHCGVSNPFRRLNDLRGYYAQAVAATDVVSEEGLSFFHDIILDHMLSHIPAEQVRFLISPDILRLEEAESQYSFSLVNTLKAYLERNCNLVLTAQCLFLHKNTLLYRLNHIRNIIRCDLNSADERLLLMLSFKLLER